MLVIGTGIASVGIAGILAGRDAGDPYAGALAVIPSTDGDGMKIRLDLDKEVLLTIMQLGAGGAVLV
jgi:hypothetical protein